MCLSANPTGGSVVAGSANIAGQGTSAVIVNQASNIAIINWQSFSINSGESTSFLQPGATSAALNRVLGGQTSLINGTLSANGQIYLINGNGIIVGPGGVINASAFTASTRDITDADFLSGHLHFTGSSDAGVQNLGLIKALDGNVALIGRTVDNEGTIKAPRGTAGLVGGDDVLLAQRNADGSTITVSPTSVVANASVRVGVKNGGTIAAAAAELKAANGNIYGLAVQNLGTIRATTVSHQGGHIWLTSDSGKVSNSGKLDASATASGGKGGEIILKSTSGTVSHTGQVVAKGGHGGTGGNAEISGAHVQFTGSVDLSAPSGTRGTLLLDPATIDVVNGGGTDITASTVDPSAIVAALNSADVVLNATLSITVDDQIDASANPNPGNLTLAALTVNLNAPLLLNGSLGGSASTVNEGPGALVQNGIDAIGASGGTVNLAGGAVYALSKEILINKIVTLEGNGATLSGQGSTRIMEIDGGTVTLDALTFTSGNGNSGIGNGSGFNGNGGALMVYGQNTTSNVSITNSTFVGNSASGGGAIFSVIISGGSNSIFMENDTFTGNSAVNGSVLYNYGAFGGNASMSLKEDTIAANSGSGAIYSTVLSSGNASVNINDSILAGNIAFSGESDYVDGGGGTLNDNGYNLYGGNGNAGGFVPGSAGATDILLTGDISTVVTPLSMFGGPTPTMALVALSPAFDTGDPAFTGAPDQRGVLRGSTTNFTGSGTDMGAFEAQLVSLQADPISVVYGSTPVFTYTVTSGLATAVASLTGTPALLSPATNVGTYGEDIGQGTVMSSPQYLVDFTNGDLTITQRPVTVNPDAGQSKIYGTTDPLLTYTTNPTDATSGLVNGDTLSGAPSYTGAGQFANVGTYATTLGTIADSTGNYIVSLSSTPPTFAIVPRAVTVDVDPGQGKIYGTTDPALTYTTEPADATTGLVNGDTLSGGADYLGSGQFASVGSYPTTPGTLANSNYVVLPGTATTFAITPRALTVIADAGQGKIYGAPDPVLTYTTAPADATTGLVGEDSLSGALDYAGSGQFTSVGNYTITQGTLANSNYTIALSSPVPTFAITPRGLTVIADAGQGKIYGSPDPVLTYTTSGLINGDTLSGALDYAGSGQFTSVGNYTITQGTLASSNYTIALSSPVPTFAIVPAILRYVADGVTVPAGGTEFPLFNGTVVGFVGADTLANATTGTVVFNAEAEPGSPAGSYPITGSGLAANLGNYQFVQDPGNIAALTIGPVTPVITPADQAATPNTPVSQAVAQTTSSTTISDPTVSLPGGTDTPLVPTVPPSIDINVSAISPNEFVDGTPGQATSDGSAATSALAQGSSFDPGVGQPVVTVGETVTLGGGGTHSTPPPPIVQAQLNQILNGGQALDTLSTALSSVDMADDQGTSASTGATTTAGTPDQTGSTAGGGETGTGSSGNPAGPGSTGPVTEVAPGQTISLSGGKANNGPPPTPVQAAFEQGFSPASRDELSNAAGTH